MEGRGVARKEAQNDTKKSEGSPRDRGGGGGGRGSSRETTYARAIGKLLVIRPVGKNRGEYSRKWVQQGEVGGENRPPLLRTGGKKGVRARSFRRKL